LISTAGARKSIQLAEREIQSRRRLAAALGENVDKLERVREITDSLQGKTLFGNEALNETAALLLNMKVRVQDLDKALIATVDTASALGVPTESVAKAIGLFQVGRAGELGERIGQLKILQDESRLAKDGVDTLLEAFGGQATLLTQTPFGAFIQKQNELGDIFEEIGIRIIPIVNEAFDKFLGKFKKFSASLDTLLQSPVFQEIARLGVDLGALVLSFVALSVAISVSSRVLKLFVGVIKLATAAVALASAGVGALAAGMVSLSATAQAVAAAIGLGLLPFSLLVIGIGALLVAVASMSGGFDRLGDSGRRLLSIVDDVRNGFSSLADIGDSIVVTLRKTVLLIDRFVVIPIRTAFSLLAEDIRFRFNSILLIVQRVAVSASLLVFSALNSVLQKAGRSVRQLGTIAATAISTIDAGIGSLVQAGINDLVTKGIDTTALEQTLQSIDSDLGTLFFSNKNRIAEIGRTTQDQLEQNADDAIRLEEQFSARADARFRTREEQVDQLANQEAALQAQAERSARLRDLREQQLRANIRDAEARKDKDSLAALEMLEIESLQRRFAAGEVSVEKFFSIRQALQEGILKREQDSLRFQLNQIREAIDEENKARAEGADIVLDTSGLLSQQLSLTKQLALVDIEIQRTNANIAEEKRAALEAQAKLRQQQQDTLDQLFEEIEKRAAEASGNTIQAALIEFSEQSLALIQQLKDAGASANEIAFARQTLELERQNMVRKSVVEQATMLLQKAQEAEGRYRESLELTRLQLEQNILTQSQAQGAARNSLQEFVSAINSSRDGLKTLQDEFPEFSESLSKTALELDLIGLRAVETTGSIIAGFQDTLRGAAETGLNDFTNRAIANVSSIGDAFRDLMRSILQSLQKFFVNQLVTRFLNFLPGLGGAKGTPGILGFNEGGLLPGRGPNRDSMSIRATPGEYIHSRSAVDHYGPSIMSAINKRRIPRALLAAYATSYGTGRSHYNTGNLVGRARSTSSSEPNVLVADETTAARILAAGKEALRDAIRNDRSVLLSILQVPVR